MSSGRQAEVDCTAEDLTAAAMWGDSQLLEGYLLNNVDPNLLNAQGNTALHVASYYGERECANTLLTFKGESWKAPEGACYTVARGRENDCFESPCCVWAFVYLFIRRWEEYL